jgi:hypothetical protein
MAPFGGGGGGGESIGLNQRKKVKIRAQNLKNQDAS